MKIIGTRETGVEGYAETKPVPPGKYVARDAQVFWVVGRTWQAAPDGSFNNQKQAEQAAEVWNRRGRV